MCRSLIFHIRIICFIKTVTNAGAGCTFPADLKGLWISADNGLLSFTTNKLSGYNIQLTAAISSVAFDCNTLSNNQYYLRGSFLFNLFGSSYRPHICLEFYRVSSDKYYYYIGTDIETTINDRIYVDMDVNNVSHADVCNRHKPFEVGTYVMLIKDGATDTSLSVICPSDISGNFQNVKFSTSDGTHSCSGKLEAITDGLKMNYTYNSCDTRITFSVYGLWHCLYTIDSDSKTFLTTVNIDASRDSGEKYRLVCYTYRSEDKTLKATIYPGSCRPNQTETYVNSPGVLVKMEISDVSDQELEYVNYEGGRTIFTGVAVGISVAVMVVVCIILLAVFIRRRYISKTTVDKALDQHDIAPSQYPIDDKIFYSQVSKGIQHKASEDTLSPYSLSEKGIYDHANERRHVVLSTDVYSHAVESVYDSSEQHTRQDRREEIYDHVFGQKN